MADKLLYSAAQYGQDARMAPSLVSRRHVDLLRTSAALCRADRSCRAACR
ncbi:putative leader peptide [Streptomyces sp. NPDC052052]